MLGDGAMGEPALGEIFVADDRYLTVVACAHVQIGLAYVVEVQIVESCTVIVEVQDECPC